jgi:ABC-type dipeptide/oligopeptide/nickel transport system permease subunit
MEARSPLEQFAPPYTFAPRMTLYGAFVAVSAALIQIFLGSLIGALWGVRIWLELVSKHSVVWKSFATLGLAICLAVSLGALIWAVRTVARKIS